ncbi:siderophore-interacting protein [Mycetocola zhadangensis]|uniref:Siderophore-interacting protein n=1 Tax=Mycetocola zhadangensis TaxID=1164595 RepID=A0A3L7J1Y2_9MICO|nr:siderophore-interacting protein [Mycetocola zhadangensis]RLQ84265.1 siderophore-interacting protein [Mycetocola zhadangensis]GGE94583.1 siderophore-interacting protein [Mycetocola zhadangensis]
MPFTLARSPRELVFRSAALTRRDWLTPNYARLRFEGDDLRGFDSLGSDDHIRVFFREPGAEPTLDPAVLRSGVSREHTPFAWDADAGILDLEFVIHGDSGVAGPWAATAPIGSTVGVGGPRGSLVLHGDPDSWFLAGDETALPAIKRFVSQMRADAIGSVFVEVPDAAFEQNLDAPAGIRVRWVHRGQDSESTALGAALDSLSGNDRPVGEVFAFIAAEQSIVRQGRALLFDRWNLDPAIAIVKGYWKRGEAEYHAPH